MANRPIVAAAGVYSRWSASTSPARAPGRFRAIRCRASPAGEFEEFRLGLEDFTEVETAEDGLGPAFNGSSCAVCHSVPAIGGAGVVAEVSAARRDETGAFGTRADGRLAVSALLDSHSHLPADHSAGGQRHLATRADPAVWCGPRRSDPRRDAPGARRSRRSRSRWHQRPRGDHHRHRHRPAPRRTVRMEGAARDAAGLRRRRLPERDGDHQRSVSAGARLRDLAGADEAVRPDPRSRRSAVSPDPPARHRQFRGLHEVSRAAGARTVDEAARGASRSSTASAAPPATCRRCRRVPARIRSSITGPCRFSPISCCTTSVPATASRRAAQPKEFARRRCGGCACAGRCCTTARRRPSRPPSRSKEGKQVGSASGSPRCRPTSAQHCWRF